MKQIFFKVKGKQSKWSDHEGAMIESPLEFSEPLEPAVHQMSKLTANITKCSHDWRKLEEVLKGETSSMSVFEWNKIIQTMFYVFSL